ncbi:hypothetical protein [Nocardia macrotermitis]|uniref:Carboxypeptidase regulatory-like domain-containing protein n=1 Tax=Nocardia macrotermitis TaxID=2585198 RepID=A0A7K0D903_9NOCA|nr:hypothetical protein [Nocardia macrotermitis]MQY22263.1 hypothetical protein [Nocardia macrotermitis]
MRRTLSALSALAAILLTVPVAGCSASPGGSAAPSSAPASAQGTVKVQAGTGTERFPVPMVAVRVTSCAADAALATLTTGNDGAASGKFPPGCYRATVTSVPSGCAPDAVANARVDVKAADTAVAKFLIHCA